MQNTGCAIEFAPAKCVIFGSRDIDNLSIRKVIAPIWQSPAVSLSDLSTTAAPIQAETAQTINRLESE